VKIQALLRCLLASCWVAASEHDFRYAVTKVIPRIDQ